MNHTNETVTTPSGGPYTSSGYAWSTSTLPPAHTRSPGLMPSVTRPGTTLTFTVDNTAPVTGALGTTGVTVGFNTTGSFTVTRTDYTDAGSGLASSVLVRDEATLSNNTCGTFTNAQTIIGTPAHRTARLGLAAATATATR